MYGYRNGPVDNQKTGKTRGNDLFLLTLLVGILYPLVVTDIARLIFPVQSNGDLLIHSGKIAGSSTTAGRSTST